MNSKIFLAGGCFWCTEAIFRRVKGVEKVLPGYIGGHLKNPSYKEVCSGRTGHAEAVSVEFDDKIILLEKLLYSQEVLKYSLVPSSASAYGTHGSKADSFLLVLGTQAANPSFRNNC